MHYGNTLGDIWRYTFESIADLACVRSMRLKLRFLELRDFADIVATNPFSSGSRMDLKEPFIDEAL